MLAHVRPALAAHGLTLTQEVICRPEKVGVKTSVFHSSGEFIDYRPLWLPAPAEATPQAYGSAITYARRYSLLAALNLASASDDDGAGSGRPAGSGKPKPSGKTATEKQIAKIHAIAREAGISGEQLAAGARRDFGCESLAAPHAPPRPRSSSTASASCRRSPPSPPARSRRAWTRAAFRERHGMPSAEPFEVLE